MNVSSGVMALPILNWGSSTSVQDSQSLSAVNHTWSAGGAVQRQPSTSHSSISQRREPIPHIKEYILTLYTSAKTIKSRWMFAPCKLKCCGLEHRHSWWTPAATTLGDTDLANSAREWGKKEEIHCVNFLPILFPSPNLHKSIKRCWQVDRASQLIS